MKTEYLPKQILRYPKQFLLCSLLCMVCGKGDSQKIQFDADQFIVWAFDTIDFNEDGFDDILAILHSSGTSGTASPSLRLFAGSENGFQSYEESTIIVDSQLLPEGTRAVIADDFNSDGEIDILFEVNTSLYMIDGNFPDELIVANITGNFPQENPHNTYLYYERTQLDDDKAPEILRMFKYWRTTNILFFDVQLDSELKSVDVHSQVFQFTYQHGFVARDWDGDGDDDALFSDFNTSSNTFELRLSINIDGVFSPATTLIYNFGNIGLELFYDPVTNENKVIHVNGGDLRVAAFPFGTLTHSGTTTIMEDVGFQRPGRTAEIKLLDLNGDEEMDLRIDVTHNGSAGAFWWPSVVKNGTLSVNPLSIEPVPPYLHSEVWCVTNPASTVSAYVITFTKRRNLAYYDRIQTYPSIYNVELLINPMFHKSSFADGDEDGDFDYIVEGFALESLVGFYYENLAPNRDFARTPKRVRRDIPSDERLPLSTWFTEKAPEYLYDLNMVGEPDIVLQTADVRFFDRSENDEDRTLRKIYIPPPDNREITIEYKIDWKDINPPRIDTFYFDQYETYISSGTDPVNNVTNDIDRNGYPELVTRQSASSGYPTIFWEYSPSTDQLERLPDDFIKMGDVVHYFDIDGDGYKDLLGAERHRNSDDFYMIHYLLPPLRPDSNTILTK